MFGPLIEIRHARHHRFEHKLREAVQRAEQCYAACKILKQFEKPARAIAIQHSADKPA